MATRPCPSGAMLTRLCLHHFERITIRQRREWGGGQRLIPERDTGEVILQGKITLVAAPAEGLDGDAKILVEADRVGDMPAVETKAGLREVDAVGPDHLGHARIRRGVLLVLKALALANIPRALVHQIAIRAAEIIF